MKRVLIFAFCLIAFGLVAQVIYQPHRRNAFRGPTAPFSPSDVAGLQIWLKGDSIVGIAEGTVISNWPSSSANTTWYATNVATSCPYLTNTFNGVAGVKALVFIQASAWWYDMPNAKGIMRNKESCTMIGVARQNNEANQKTIWAAAKGAASSLIRDGFYFNNSEQAGAIQITLDADSAVERKSPTASSVTVAVCVTVESVHTNSVTVTGSSITLWTNNIQAVTGAGSSSTNTSDTDSTTVRVGRQGSLTTTDFSGEIAEILVYQPAISAANRTNVWLYLKSKYGL